MAELIATGLLAVASWRSGRQTTDFLLSKRQQKPHKNRIKARKEIATLDYANFGFQ